MQKINSVRMVSFEPKVDSYSFLLNDSLSIKKDYYLNFTNRQFGPAQHVSQQRTLWGDIVHFVHKDVNFKVGRLEHTIPVGQLITTTCLLCAGLLILYVL